MSDVSHLTDKIQRADVIVPILIDVLEVVVQCRSTEEHLASRVLQ